MAVDTSRFLKCSLGGQSFMAEDYDVQETAQVDKVLGRTGTSFKIKIDGFVDAGPEDDFQGRLDAALSALRSDAQDLIITGLAGLTEYRLLAAWCLNNGPHTSLEISAGSGPWHKKIKLTVEADMQGGADPVTGVPQGPTDSFKVKVATGPDLLRIITRSGVLNGPGAYDEFVNGALSETVAAYPYPNWIITSEAERATDANASQVTYTITAVELAAPLPFTTAGDFAVTGDATISRNRDEQKRLTSVYNFDLVLRADSDPRALHEQLRSGVGDASQITRETMEISLIRQVRLRSSFTLLAGDGDELISWSQSLKIVGDEETYEVKTFVGSDPLAVRRPKTFKRLTQSGQATGLGKFPSAPSPLGALLAEEPDVQYQQLDEYVCQTSWTYVLLDDGGGAIGLDALARPRPAAFAADSDGLLLADGRGA